MSQFTKEIASPRPRGYVSRPCINIQFNNLTDVPGRVADDEVVQWLHDRLLSGQCYTWIGVALVAVNARQAHISQLFSENVKECFQNFGKAPLLPHVYAVAAKARHRLVHGLDGKHQAVVISGDSGSGKTFTASHTLKWLLSRDEPTTNQSRLHKIWASVPILMSFGNASTECNANSSRFGKLIQLQHEFGSIRGAFIQVFLLEKTRVASQGRDQRNFHIFHQMLAGLPAEDLQDLHLDPASSYAIVPPEMDDGTLPLDREGFLETMAAMRELGMGGKEIREVQRVLAVIVHLGTIEYCHSKEGTGFTGVLVDEDNTACMKSFEAVCVLLGISEMSLRKLLTTSLIAPRSSNKRCTVYHMQLFTIESCMSRRDSIMRFLYEKLFCWIVSFINRELKVDKDSECHNLGILDIYGFEKFQVNSLEQLCINYANERLQHYFVHNFVEHARSTLQLELDDDFAYTSCNKYDITLALLDVPSLSIFAILNEESILARNVNEAKVVERIYSDMKYNMNLIKSKYCPETPQFIVKHFAGEVCYNAHKMCEKNMDKVPSELKNSLITCKNSFIATLIMDELVDEYNIPSTKKSTVLNKYQSSLDKLLTTLDSANVYFIRCVKASHDLEPDRVDFSFLKQQLVASGVMDLIPLNCHRFRHFPYWFKSSDFMLRYSKLLTHPPTNSLEFVTRMKANSDMCDHIKVGRASVFVSEAGIQQLEEWKQDARVGAVVVIQKAWRRYCSGLKDIQSESKTLSQTESPQEEDNEACVTVNSTEELSSSASNKIESHSACTSCETPHIGSNLVKKRRVKFESLPEQMVTHWKDCDLPNKTACRDIFIGEGIVSRLRLAMVPIKFHTRLTCLKYSHYLPASELASGLQDALQPDNSQQLKTDWTVL